MGRITIDDGTREKLAASTAPGGITELCDGAGNVVGYFTPTARAAPEPQISDEEIERRTSEGKLYTHEEVMAHLKGL